jgi:hypothetical protein
LEQWGPHFETASRLQGVWQLTSLRNNPGALSLKDLFRSLIKKGRPF